MSRPRQVRGGRALTGLALGVTLVLAGCSSDGDGSGALKVAQAKVSAKEKALSAAKADATAATAAFCDASATYITALDRYGDVLTQSAVTVGDVTTAGTDLAEPREDVTAAADAAVAGQQAVADAKNALADAEAALAALQSPSATSSPQPSASPKPLVPAGTVNRVKEAETELAAAQQGITDETPLAQASEQFNAAVVALEMSWLQLFADAGCLTDEQRVQAQAAVRDYTKALQKSLKEAGYFTSEVDGVYGPDTVDAVETLQKTHSLPVTGTLDKATAAALQADLAAKGGAVAQEAVASTSAVQQTLKLAGYWDGPVDGEWTPALTEALKEFQKALGVKPSGEVDAATVAALETALEELGQQPSASASPSASAGSPTGETPTGSSSP